MDDGVSIFSRRPETYEEHPDLLKWVKADPCGPLGRMLEIVDSGQVLDVGSGAGILGRLFKENPKVIADGVDPAIAPDTPGVRHYRRYDQCLIEDILEQERVGSYDWFVLADVIEHLPYPDRKLGALVRASSPAAKFLISTPNIGHISTRLGLLNGEFEYTASGILESTHLRFFTHNTLRSVVAAAGLGIERLICLNRPHYPDALDRMPAFRAFASLYAMGSDSFPMTYQFLAVCSKGAGNSGAIEVVGNSTRRTTLAAYLSRRYGLRWPVRA